jgi:hypothetical protein
MLWNSFPKLFHKVVKHKRQVFSIGIYKGCTLFNLNNPHDYSNPVITSNHIYDLPAAFTADPFLWVYKNRNYLFFEIFNKLNKKGVIGVAISDDFIQWNYLGKVLIEPFHLAYPHIFKYENDIYMIPDSPGMGVRLYKATDFPFEWRYVSTIIENTNFVDSTPLNFNQLWWIFTASSLKSNDSNSLHLFFSESIFGPWHEHPKSPIINSDSRFARPAGRIQIINGNPVRFSQNSLPKYGTSVYAFFINTLNRLDYSESLVSSNPILDKGSQKWNSGGMHHLDAIHLPNGTWTAFVDGWYWANFKDKY